jgi:hypothetical protein
LQHLARFILLCSLMFAAGCSLLPVGTGTSLETTPSPNRATPLPTETILPNQGGEMTPENASLQALIEKAKVDLAQRLSIAETQINFVEATEVEWSDSSLGCPQPGMDYLQVITPGYRILLEANATQYEYHSNRDAYFVFCEDQNPIIPPKP